MGETLPKKYAEIASEESYGLRKVVILISSHILTPDISKIFDPVRKIRAFGPLEPWSE